MKIYKYTFHSEIQHSAFRHLYLRRCIFGSMTTFVKAQPGDTSDSLVRKFMRKVLNDDLLVELRKKEFYQKPAEIRKEAKKELKRRLRRRNP